MGKNILYQDSEYENWFSENEDNLFGETDDMEIVFYSKQELNEILSENRLRKIWETKFQGKEKYLIALYKAYINSKNRDILNAFYRELQKLPSELQVVAMDKVHKSIYKDFFRQLKQQKKEQKLMQKAEKVMQRVRELQLLNPLIEIKITKYLIQKILRCDWETARKIYYIIENYKNPEKNSKMQ